MLADRILAVGLYPEPGLDAAEVRLRPAAGSGSEAPLTAAGATNPFGDPWPTQSQSVPAKKPL